MVCGFESALDGTEETLQPLKAQWPRLRCVVLVQDRAAFRQAKALGADVVLPQGVLAAKLLETVERLLSGTDETETRG
jgi:DNA-binding NarL/FixJ family response regulator